jgi:hypothetical protein
MGNKTSHKSAPPTSSTESSPEDKKLKREKKKSDTSTQFVNTTPTKWKSNSTKQFAKYEGNTIAIVIYALQRELRIF